MILWNSTWLEKGVHHVAPLVVKATNPGIVPVRFKDSVKWLGFKKENNMTQL